MEQLAINAFNEATYKQAADKIRQQLSSIRNNPTASAKRWVWELMQNAKDVPNKYGKVSIEIELVSDKELQFRHNGDPFSINNIVGLIRQVSSKDSLNSDNETTGKFGTGFICTHLLSDVIDVSGILDYNDAYRQFNLSLDRSGRSSEELMPRIKDTEQPFYQPEVNFKMVADYELKRKESDFNTTFTYHLTTEEKLLSAKAGLDDLANTLPITLVSQAKNIKSVRIIDKVRGTNVTYVCTSQNIDDHVMFSEIQIDSEVKQYLTYTTEEVALTIEVKKDNGRYFLQKRDSRQPVLYRDFPLIGSESFYFPFTLNGFNLFPTEKRNSIPLNGDDNAEAKDNRSIINHAVETAIKFSEWLVSHQCENRYLLAYSRRPKPEVDYDDRIAKPWIEKLQKEWRQKLLDIKLVETSTGEDVLRNISIPIFKNSSERSQEFYGIVAENHIGRGVLPKPNMLLGWINAIKPEYDTWCIKLKYEIEDLLNDIQNKKSLSILSESVKKSKTDTISWLNKLYKFIVDNDLLKLFNEYAILPNQKGDFTLLNELKSEHQYLIPPILKTIYNSVVVEESIIEITLVDNDVNSALFGNNLPLYGVDEIIKSLNDLIKNSDTIVKNESRIKCDETVAYRIISLLPPEICGTEWVSKIRKMYELSASYREMSDLTQIDVTNTDLWKEAELYWFNHSFEKIEELRSVNKMASTFFLQHKTDEEALRWLNQYIQLFRDYAKSDIIKKHAVFPNQLLDFEILDKLHYDNNIEEEFKDLAEYITDSNSRHDIFRPKLLHRSIQGFESHNPLSVKDVYEDIKKAFDDKPNLQDCIATQTIALIPQTDEEDSSYKQLYNFAKTMFGESIPELKSVSQSDGFKWSFAQKYYIQKISKAIAESATIRALQDKVPSLDKQTRVYEWINSFIEFINRFKQKKYWDIITDSEKGHGIWINQKNEFCKFQDVHPDDSIPEELKDIALNKWVNIDYREQLSIKDLHYTAYLNTTPITIGEIGHEIDKKIKEYVDEENSLQNRDFTALILTINKLCDKYPKLKEAMIFFEQEKNRLIVGTLGKGDTMDIVAYLIQAGDDKLKLAKELVDNLNENELWDIIGTKKIKKEFKKHDGSSIIISIAPHYGQDVSIMENALIEAKNKVKTLLESKGYSFTKGICEESYGNIYGVMKNGVEYPLVVHSYKRQKRPFQLTVFDWEQLAKPNSMLWINTYSGLKCITFKELSCHQGINLSIDSSNFDYLEKCTLFAQMLRYFKGLHFNFGNPLPPCSDEIKLFIQKDNEITNLLSKIIK